MAIEEYYSSRLMVQGTEQAEDIYNELIGRTKSAHGRIRSRTLTAPPGSPVTHDAYLVASPATGDWASHEFEIAVFSAGWKFMIPQSGFWVYVEDEDQFIYWYGTGTPLRSAVDGSFTLVSVFQTGSERAFWDAQFGLNAVLTLSDNTILMAPVNMRAGKIYLLTVVQDGVGSRTLTYEAGEWARVAAGLVVPIASGIGQVTQLQYNGPAPPLNKPIEFANQQNIVLVS